MQHVSYQAYTHLDFNVKVKFNDKIFKNGIFHLIELGCAFG